jgi:hypothetical protein
LTITLAPALASSVAIACPIPWVDPETSARRPARSIRMVFMVPQERGRANPVPHVALDNN